LRVGPRFGGGEGRRRWMGEVIPVVVAVAVHGKCGVGRRGSGGGVRARCVAVCGSDARR
jgi:hypothetical protein